jgi:putative ABC transport system permease protein
MVLSTLGVIMGVGSIVAVLAIGDGVEVFARDQVARTTDLLMVIVTPRTTERLDGVLVPRTDVTVFQPDDFRSLRSAVPEAKTVTLARSGGSVAQRSSGSSLHGMIVTAVVSTTSIQAPALHAGTFLGDSDLVSSRQLTVLTASAATLLARGENADSLVGQTVLIRGLPFTVVGVLAERAHDRAEAFVPWQAAEGVLASTDVEKLPMLTLVAASLDSVERMVGRVERWAEARYPVNWRDRIEVRANVARLRQWAQAILVFKLLMGAITSISLLVGGIGIMNVLLAAVAERTREIGIRKAVGARKQDVIIQFLAESMAITCAGSAIGLALGFVTAIGTAAIMRTRTGAPVHAALSVSTILLAAGASIAVGIAFGVYPAIRAAQLSPVEAIRHE